MFLYKDQTILNKEQTQVQGNHTGAVIRTKSNVI
jgi:hypothetical protein